MSACIQTTRGSYFSWTSLNACRRRIYYASKDDSESYLSIIGRYGLLRKYSKVSKSIGVSSNSTELFSSISPGTKPSSAYETLVKNGKLNADPVQQSAVRAMDPLFDQVVSYNSITGLSSMGNFSLFNRLGLSLGLGRRFGGASRSTSNENLSQSQSLLHSTAPRGIYLWGGVGCGKTMIMDLFFHCVPVKSKRKAHFHAFMLDIHKRMYKAGGVSGNDAVPEIARTLVKDGWLFCFDEFQVTDIGDAMILSRLFSEMFKAGAVMIATSNRPPTDLYLHGIQRESFLPFIDILKNQCQVYELSSEIDYRLTGTANPSDAVSGSSTFMFPLSADVKTRLKQLVDTLIKFTEFKGVTLKTQGRSVNVYRSANGVAVFGFKELCSKAVGAADFIAIAETFHTVVIEDIPVLTLAQINETRRFITLVDCLYEHKVKLICSAEEPISRIFSTRDDSAYMAVVSPKTEASSSPPLHALAKSAILSSPKRIQVSSRDRSRQKDEEFAFDRTVSRLMEMQSQEYLRARHGAPIINANITFLRPFILKVNSSNPTMSLSDLRDIWSRYDRDGRGYLNVMDLQTVVEDMNEVKTGKRQVANEKINSMFHVLDRNEDGLVEWEEFQWYFQDISRVSQHLDWRH